MTMVEGKLVLFVVKRGKQVKGKVCWHVRRESVRVEVMEEKEKYVVFLWAKMKSDWLEMRINDIQNTKCVSETGFMAVVIASVRLHVNTTKQRNIHLQRLIGYFQMRYVYTILRSQLYLSRTGISERMIFYFF